MASKTSTRSTKSTTETTETKRSSKGTSVNRVILVGRLVATPELRTTASGIHVTTVRIATNDREQPEFHDVVLWRQLADFATKYMTKGRLAYIEGRLQSPHLGSRRRLQAPDGRGRRRHLQGAVAEAGRRAGGLTGPARVGFPPHSGFRSVARSDAERMISMYDVNNPWLPWRPVDSGAAWVTQSQTLRGAALRELMRQGRLSPPDGTFQQPTPATRPISNRRRRLALVRIVLTAVPRA